jgi:hypothetical protein
MISRVPGCRLIESVRSRRLPRSEAFHHFRMYSRGSGAVTPASLATWWWSPGGDGDGLGRRAGGCRCGVGGRVPGGSGAEEGRCNGEEAHFDDLLIIKGV